MTENKRYIDGGEECIEDQFLIDTETDENFFIDHGLDKIIERLNEQEEIIQSLKERKKALEKEVYKLSQGEADWITEEMI